MTTTNPYSRLSQPRRKLFQGTLTTAAKILYRCPDGKSARIDSIYMTNIHSGSVSVRIHHTLPNEPVADSNALYYDLSCSSKTTTIDDSPKWMTAGETIQALAGSSGHLVVTIYGTEE